MASLLRSSGSPAPWLSVGRSEAASGSLKDAPTAGFDHRLVSLERSIADQTRLDRTVPGPVPHNMIAEHRTPARELVGHVTPTVARVFTNKVGKADLALPEHCGDPQAVLGLGKRGLTVFIRYESNGLRGPMQAKGLVLLALHLASAHFGT